VAGVLAGLAIRLGVDPLLLRIAFGVLVVATGGVALLFYALAWAVVPVAGESRPPAAIRRLGAGVAHPGWRVAAGAGLLTLAALLVFRQLGIWWSDALVWPLVLAGAGAAVLWRQSRALEPPAPAAEPAALPASPPATSEAATARRERGLQDLYRGGFGVALVVGAALLFLTANDALGGVREAALAAIVAVFALALILAPFLWRLGRNLAAERAERIRSQERAELAAHLHDSVLQTLTLMQKRADDPRQVATLARRQERELRGWLHGRSRPAGESFAAALQAAAEEVEDDHGVAIEVVAVGDRKLDERSRAVVAAAREALTNAAKFAPEPSPVSVYAEVSDGRLEVFVHDRGEGFDPDAVAADRRGVRDSIVGRMKRHGGSAEIRSRPGEGTEVALTMEAER
jgi:signal transduction histidine kinase/phage shock protein PspC (stress-responsive transcriptional regulator)